MIGKVICQIPCFHVYETLVHRRFGDDHAEVCLAAMMHNAALDSTLINLRALNEFFKPGGLPDDIRAHHFSIPKSTPFLQPPEEAEINKHLAHITTLRATTIPKPWYIDDMVSRGLTEALVFLVALEGSFPFTSEEARNDVSQTSVAAREMLVRITVEPTSDLA